MTKLFLLLTIVAVLASCSTTTYYVSRHAEKSGAMTADPPLTAAGEQQAQNLRHYLRDKKLKAVYSTNYTRTKSTAQPTADIFQLPVLTYNPASADKLLDSLVAGRSGNVLLVGHSNTVDDLVNHLTKTKTLSDLADSEYGDVFMVKKKGSKTSFERIKLPPAK